MLSEYKKEWIGLMRSDMTEFINLFDEYILDLQKALKSKPHPNLFWGRIESLISRQSAWSEKTEKIIEIYRQKDFWRISDEFFNSLVDEFPEKITIPAVRSDWNYNSADPIVVFIWKLCKRFTFTVRRIDHYAANKIRIMFKKPALPPLTIKDREIYLRLLLHRHIRIPLTRSLLGEWQVFRRESAKILYNCHNLSESFLNLLISDRKSEYCWNRDYSEFENIHSQIQEFHRSILGIIEDFCRFPEKDNDVPTKFYEAIKDEFSDKWQYSGTKALPVSKYNDRATDAEKLKIIRELNKTDSSWNKFIKGECSEWRKDLELVLLQLKTIIISANLLINTKERIEKEIVPAYSQNRSLVEESIANIKSLKKLTKSKFIIALNKENRQLIRGLGQEKILLLLDEAVQTQLIIDFKIYYTHIADKIETIPSKQSLLIKREFEKNIPNPKIEDVPSRELINMYGLEPLKSEHRDLMQHVDNTIRKTLRTISMMDQIIEFQFETAISLVQQNKGDDFIQDSEQVLIEGLERLLAQFDDLIAGNHTFIQTSREKVLKMTWDFIDSIQLLKDSEKVFDLKIKLTKAKTKAKYKSYRELTLQQIKLQAQKTGNFFKKIVLGIFQSYRHIRKLTGIEVSKLRFEDEIQRMITTNYQPIDRLPLVYQRLFKIEALTETRFYLHRKKEFDTLEEEFLKWEKESVSAAVIIGEKGSGKSTLINYAKDQLYGDYKAIEIRPKITISTEEELLKLLITAFHFEGIDSLDDLEKQIIEKEEPFICIFENLQRTFLRKVGGFRALDRLLLFITRTSCKIHWVVSCSLYSWEFLNKVLSCSKYFHRVIHLEELSAHEIQSIIMQRHRTSGFDIRFKAPISVTNSSKFKKLDSADAQQIYLEELFFNDLQSIAKGNISVAMLFWITAIMEIKKDELIIDTVLNWDQSPFQKMPQDELFTLAAIIQHDGLTDFQHSKVFYQDFTKSLALLNRMKNNGILIENHLGYSIQPILYRPIVQVLRDRNILH